MPGNITEKQAQANHSALATPTPEGHLVFMNMTATDLNIRRADEHGHADQGGLAAHHTFSFADYYDPAPMGFRSLRVINEDRVAPGMGFDTHPHHDMEIFSYVLEGTPEHRDSMGNGRQLKPDQIEWMNAGRGILHRLRQTP